MFANLGQGLILARELRGWSRDQLAARSGIPLARLSDYETGHKVLRLESLGRLLAALELSPFAFFSLQQRAATADRPGLDLEGLEAAISAAVLQAAALYRATLEQGLGTGRSARGAKAPKSRVVRARRSGQLPRG